MGYTPPAYARDLVAMGLRQEVHSLEYARALHEELKGSERRLKVHIKLDTGMSRLGFFAYDHPKTVEELKEVAQMPKLLIEGIFMHFPVADSIDGADANFTHTQFERFTQMLSALKGVGIERRSATAATAARPSSIPSMRSIWSAPASRPTVCSRRRTCAA